MSQIKDTRRTGQREIKKSRTSRFDTAAVACDAITYILSVAGSGEMKQFAAV